MNQFFSRAVTTLAKAMAQNDQKTVLTPQASILQAKILQNLDNLSCPQNRKILLPVV